jgi:hypothetical protein
LTHEDMVGPARAGHEVAKGENIRNTGNVTSCARNFKSHRSHGSILNQDSLQMKPLPGVVNMMKQPQYVDPRRAGGYAPSLATVVATHGPLPVRSVLTLAAGLAEALSAAHADALTHHDLSPVSVLLTADGPRLIGPGGPPPAGLGQPARDGTLDFASPEQAAVLQARPASDIYSLGAVLLYAATGNLMPHFIWHLEQLPGELRPVIERCMAADPARRPTASQLLTELTADRPAAVSEFGGWAAGTQMTGAAPTGPAPYGVWPGRGGTPAPPFPAPYGSWPAQGWPYAPSFPASAVALDPRKARRKPSRAAARIKRHAGLIAVAMLAFAVAVAGTVYVIHPWPYPVLRPAGLTADQRGTTSISLGWSNPASGPLPDKYVILRNGAVTATVPGNQDHFNDAGLAPATTYNFQIIAYRGTTRSQPSLDLRAATQTPQLSDAAFNSVFQVTEGLETNTSTATQDTVGDTWHDHWTFSSKCAVGPCDTRLSGAIDGQAFTAVLTADGNGTYSGTAPVNHYFQCSDSATGYVDSTLQIAVTASAARDSRTQWLATKLSGSVSWVVGVNPSGSCGGGSLFITVAG